MLLVPTYVDKSSIHGFGVFSGAPIRAGDVVWRLDPRVDWVVSAEEVGSMPELFRPRFLVYASLGRDGSYLLCGDNAMLMNHSPAPNLAELGEYSVAVRDIPAREELTSDYRSFDLMSARSNDHWLS